MIGQPITGAGYLWRGFKLLNAPGLRRYVALPLAINFLVFSLLLWLAASQFGALVDSLMPQLPDWLSWLEWLFWTVFALLAALVVFFTFTIVANIIGAPFNGLLAEAVERKLTGKPAEDDGGLLLALKEAPTAILDELKKLGYFALWAVPLLILFLIPLLNLAAPILWVLFSVWMLAVEYADYPMGNHGLLGGQQRDILRQRRFLSLGFGGATLAGTMIPVVNFFVMPAAVAGATVMWVEQLQEQARLQSPE